MTKPDWCPADALAAAQAADDAVPRYRTIPYLPCTGRVAKLWNAAYAEAIARITEGRSNEI